MSSGLEDKEGIGSLRFNSQFASRYKPEFVQEHPEIFQADYLNVWGGPGSDELNIKQFNVDYWKGKEFSPEERDFYLNLIARYKQSKKISRSS